MWPDKMNYCGGECHGNDGSWYGRVYQAECEVQWHSNKMQGLDASSCDANGKFLL